MVETPEGRHHAAFEAVAAGDHGHLVSFAALGHDARLFNERDAIDDRELEALQRGHQGIGVESAEVFGCGGVG